jgi:LacI family transcriptional regulator
MLHYLASRLRSDLIVFVIFRGRMSKRPTIQDVAKASGVSVATVDRVLNERLPVRAGTAARVAAAAEALGYHATGLLKQRLRGEVPKRTFGFLLQKRAHDFYRALGEEVAAAVQANTSVRGRAVIEFVDELSPAAITRALREAGARVDALAVVAVDHPSISEAVAELKARSVPCFALLSDISAPARAGYIGIDNRKAGRTAAWMIARTSPQPGPVGVLVGSHRYLGHDLREMGARAYFREHAPDFAVLEPLVNLDEPRIAYEGTLDLMKRHLGLVGIIVAGGGMEGVIGALRDEKAEGRICVVCNELTSVTRAALIDRVVTCVIATPRRLLAERAVAAMAAAAAGGEGFGEEFLPFEIYVSENI